ncbi:RIB43A-like with coiled-coil protein 2 [Taenia solium]|eukprot:TsM_000811200 transcript=TsM_000811200 gene=TsM_000811200
MYKVILPVDRKEAAAIERRRIAEEQRKARIFNERIRLIGVDESALAQQVKDKREREEHERCRDIAYGKDAERNDKIAVLLERRQQNDQRELNRALNEFRLLHQQPSSRREFDLNDPDAKKKDRPARISDDDPRCGVSSIQKFVGEDLTKKSREKFQQEQMQNWFDRQIEERNRAECARKHDEHLQALYGREMDGRVQAMARAETACRRAVQCAVRRYNEALAAERADAERAQRRCEEEANAREILNSINSDFLTENPAQAVSAFGPHRICPDRYKGFSPEQLAEIRQKQCLQIREKACREAEEKQLNNQFDSERVRASRVSLLLERNLERQARDYRKKVAQENMLLAQDQKAFQKYLNEEVYRYQPTAAYFMQFNTTSR